ncbi:uncharacterized protein LOC123310800 [Coccinella septempunctata]|uniref:uncharacterized protein LOC123310800 n=1 Tax=Coccinella septempunctata TaxID=41139 RepID=UPI001D071D3A|nr:uncharacterized protein LOC123310800 [Coccinella septempunctata]
MELDLKTAMKELPLFFFLLMATCLGKELPSFLHVCSDNDPNVNDCMISAIEDLRPYLKKGVPEYNIPCLEPLILEDLITEDISGLKVKVANVSAYGCSDFIVQYVNVNWENRSMEMDLDIPELKINAHYLVNGKVLMVPIKGKGDIEANITDCSSQTLLQMEKYEVDGERHVKFSNVNIKVKVGGGRIRLENLFNGDDKLLSFISEVVNRNLQMFLKELMPILEKGLARKFMEVGNNVVEQFTCRQLVPTPNQKITLVVVEAGKMFLRSLLFVCGAVLVTAKIPDYIKICKSTEPNMAQCITDSVNALRPYLKAGIPELDVPPLEPLFLDEIKLRSGPNAAKLDANFTNVKVWGPSDFKILEMKPNVAKKRFAFKVTVPQVYFEGDYDIDMHILLLKYKGKGPVSGNFTDYFFDCIMKGRTMMIEGKDYLKFDKMRCKLQFGKSSIKLANLFKEDPVLARATDDVIEENTELFLAEIKPILEDALAEKFTDIANKLTLKFTYQELFP